MFQGSGGTMQLDEAVISLRYGRTVRIWVLVPRHTIISSWVSRNQYHVQYIRMIEKL